MTAGDARLDAIQARLDAAQHHGAPAFMIPTADVAYLLAELRKAREALTRAWAEGHESGFWNGRLSQLSVPYDAPDPLIGKAHADATNPYRAAVAAANGDGEKP